MTRVSKSLCMLVNTSEQSGLSMEEARRVGRKQEPHQEDCTFEAICSSPETGSLEGFVLYCQEHTGSVP